MAYSRETELEKIYGQLPAVTDSQKSIIGDLYDDWYNIALEKSNRIAGQETPALLAIIRDITIAAYNKRGDEGMTESEVGGQTYYYQDLEDQLQKSIIGANLRFFKL
ncbi:MAG TPA: phage head-tail connector protein [Caproicibacter sp.]|nr:phage head-tail connector protein [Caproicibacter sp.]